MEREKEKERERERPIRGEREREGVEERERVEVREREERERGNDPIKSIGMYAKDGCEDRGDVAERERESEGERERERKHDVIHSSISVTSPLHWLISEMSITPAFNTAPYWSTRTLHMKYT